MEEQDHEIDQIHDGSDEGSGEDLMDNMEAYSSNFIFVSDYGHKPELDRYENEGIDDEEQKELDFQTRREAERELNQRERLMNRGGRRIPGALLDEELNEYSEEGLLNK